MQIDGSTFTLGVTLTSSGSEARLNIGTDLAYAPTVFNSTLSVYMNGRAAEIYLSNAGASVPMFVAKSNLSLIGGTPAGTYYVQGPISVVSTKFTRSNFNTTPPSSPPPGSSLAGEWRLDHCLDRRPRPGGHRSAVGNPRGHRGA